MTKVGIDKSTFILLYNRNKDYIIPIVTIIVSFVLLIGITIPQLSNLSAQEQQVKYEKDKLTTLKDNLKVLSSFDESTLDSQLAMSSDALPSSKNFAGVLNSISDSSNKAGVFLGDYGFQVGDLANDTVPSKGYPNLQLSLSVTGSVLGTARFIDQLYKTSPVSEVTSIQIGSGRASLNTLFYYKPFAHNIVDQYAPVPSLTKADYDTLKEISSWDDPIILEQVQPILTPNPSSSSSAF